MLAAICARPWTVNAPSGCCTAALQCHPVAGLRPCARSVRRVTHHPHAYSEVLLPGLCTRKRICTQSGPIIIDWDGCYLRARHLPTSADLGDYRASRRSVPRIEARSPGVRTLLTRSFVRAAGPLVRRVAAEPLPSAAGWPTPTCSHGRGPECESSVPAPQGGGSERLWVKRGSKHRLKPPCSPSPPPPRIGGAGVVTSTISSARQDHVVYGTSTSSAAAPLISLMAWSMTRWRQACSPSSMAATGVLQPSTDCASDNKTRWMTGSAGQVDPGQVHAVRIASSGYAQPWRLCELSP